MYQTVSELADRNARHRPPDVSQPASSTPSTGNLQPSSPGPESTTKTPVEDDATGRGHAYTVEADDTVYSIAQMYGLGTQTLVDYNGWPDGEQHGLGVGDVVRIPPGVTESTTAILTR